MSDNPLADYMRASAPTWSDGEATDPKPENKNNMSDFKKSLTFVALAGAIFLSAIALIGGNSFTQQTRKIEAYDRCLATQVQVAKLGGYPPSCSQ